MRFMTTVRAAEIISSKMLANTGSETEGHHDVCHATNGAHIEIY
jgi:hypothetical protein